ncbi:MAG: general stress protein [Thalassobius sp.]|nr:general stress protein [Thalassovita sp.]
MALIILAHPNYEKSTSNKTIIEALEKSSLDIKIRNLAALYPDYKIDVKAEQEALLRHENIIFQYPFYWYNMPAILKLWFDVVFEYQFAYGSKGDKLKDKNFIASFTVGAPEKEYNTLGEHHFRVMEFCKNLEQTAYYAKMHFINPVYSFGNSLNAGMAPEEVKQNAGFHAKKLIEVVKRLEAPLVS